MTRFLARASIKIIDPSGPSRSTLMEEDRSFANEDNSSSATGTKDVPPAKRSKKPSAKAQESSEPSTSSKQPQMVASDPLYIFVASMIEGDPDKWGVLLTNKHGKVKIAMEFIVHLSQHTNPLTRGKTSTSETLAKWIKHGRSRAEAETTRRATAAASGRSEDVAEVDTVWFKVMQTYAEYLKDKPANARYTTPPEHLKGLVALEYDKSALMRVGREDQL